MKPFKDFLVKEETIIEKDDGILLPEGYVYSEEPLFEGDLLESKDNTPPAVLVMRRMSIRMFPNGQKIALYKIDKLEKFITVPFEDTDKFIRSTESTK